MGHHEQNGKSDEWYTPKYIFDALECNFDLDVASPVDRSFCSVPADRYLTENALDTEWNGFVWMNPPFGGRNGIIPWLDKIFLHGDGISLTPDRTSSPWWQDAAKKSDAILFINGKVKFIKPDGSIGKQPSNGTTLFAIGDIGVDALKRAEDNKLGIVTTRSLMKKLSELYSRE